MRRPPREAFFGVQGQVSLPITPNAFLSRFSHTFACHTWFVSEKCDDEFIGFLKTGCHYLSLIPGRSDTFDARRTDELGILEKCRGVSKVHIWEIQKSRGRFELRVFTAQIVAD